MPEESFPTYRLGAATITKIPEIAFEHPDATTLLPESTPAEVEAAAAGIGPGSRDPASGHLRMSIHSWLVRLPGRVILVDTGTGNAKERPTVPLFHHRSEPFLERLAAAGVRPEEVDLVLLTHLHADHVGWNTRLAAGRWVPTFPRARYLFSARERAYNEALIAGDGSDAAMRAAAGLGAMHHAPLPGVYEDSVLPVLQAGRAEEITVDGQDVAEGFSFLPSPGHSIDHAAIRLRSEGAEALFWGDVLHHPLQVARPDWNSVYCEFPEAARRSRGSALAYAAESGALVLTTHFGESSAGRVTRAGDRFTWHFA
ncbi:MBL fold metallo-hydrolase [Acidisoma sp. C75]